jgi:hypothetical protein
MVCRTTAGAWTRKTGERESGRVVMKEGGEKEGAFVRVCARLCTLAPAGHRPTGPGVHNCRRHMPSISKSICHIYPSIYLPIYIACHLHVPSSDRIIGTRFVSRSWQGLGVGCEAHLHKQIALATAKYPCELLTQHLRCTQSLWSAMCPLHHELWGGGCTWDGQLRANYALTDKGTSKGL